MTFRAMDAGCGGTDGPDGLECARDVTAVGLHPASGGAVWQAFACDHHAHHLIAPRPLRLRDQDVLARRQRLAEDPRIGRRYAGERDGPVARGSAATALLRDAIAWAKRHPIQVADRAAAAASGTASRMTLDQLADDLGVEPGDVGVLLSWLDPEGGGLHADGSVRNDVAAAVRDQIDHLCERTVPQYWWPGSDPDAGKGATKMR